MSLDPSRRTLVVNAFRDAFSKVGQTRWTFVRALPNWATMEWPRPFVVAFVVERAPLLADSGELSVAMQVFHRHGRKTSEEFDDADLDEMKRDCAAVLEMVRKQRDSNGDPVILHLAADREDEGMFESHDLAGLRVEGFVARFRVKY